MKRTFSTTFFRRALFLVLLFGGVTNLWGENKSLPNDGTLSFAWSSRSGGHLLGSWTWSDNCISDGLWEWSGEGENQIKMSQSIYCTFKVPGTYNAQTRDRYEFDAGTYTFTFYYYFDESGCQYYEPEVRLSVDQDRNTVFVSPKGSYVDGHSTGAYTKVVEVEVLSKGYYYIRLITGLNNEKPERFGYQKVVIAKAGPTPPPTPTEKLVYLDLNEFTDWEKDNAHFCIWDGSENYEMSKVESCNNGNTHLYSVDVPNMASSKTLYIKRADNNCGKWNEVSVSTSISDTKNKMRITGWDAGTWETFTPPTYTVTYAAGAHGSGTMTDSNSPYACGSDVTVLENEFTAARGYVFNNFSDGSSTYDAGDVIEDLQAVKTLTAQWTALTSYTITASASPSHKGHVNGAGTYYEGETVTLTAVSEDDSKYMFDDWSDGDKSNPRVFTAQSGIATNYEANFISGKKECTNTLTIQCEDSYLPLNAVTGGNPPSKDDLKVYINGEGDYASSSHGNGYICVENYGEKEVYFAFDAPEAGTYKFNAWVGQDKEMWLNVYTTDQESGDAVTYNAQTYKKKGNMKLYGSGSGSTFAAMGDLSVDLPSGMCIIGLYGGWSWAAYDQIVITASANVFCTITPAAKCTISYAMNGHGTQIGDVSIEEGETWTAPTPDPTEYGWKFDGWKRPNGTGDETLYKSGDAGFTVSGNETLTAQWSEDLSTAYFMKGTFNGENWGTQHDFVKKTGESTGNIAYVTLDNLNAGYDYYFLVWDNNKHGCTVDGAKITKGNNVWTLNGNKDVGLTTTAKGSYTFTLDFTDANNPQITVTYPTADTITFANGNPSATGTMNNMVNIAENEEVTLTANNYKLSCNHFVKWKDQDNNEYEDGAQVTVTKNLTLTAQWAINRYKAIYDANGVTGYTGDLPATVEYDCGDQVTISQTPRLSKFGYTFIGWNTDPNATVALADNYQFTIDQGDTKIYAIWSATKPLSITIAPATGGSSPTKGSGVQMNATLDPDASTMAEENRALTWSSSDATRAFINQQGQVSFVGTGDVTITATANVDNNVKGNYTFHVQAGNCDGLKIHAFGTGYEEDDYFHPISYGATEWRCPYVLKNGADKFWVGDCNGWQEGKSDNQSFNDIPLRDYRDVKTNPAQDLVGTLVIWNDSKDKNYFICFEPTYQVSYMTDASTWRIMELYPTSDTYAYETELLQVPEGYKNNSNMKYFVGLKKADGTNVSIYNKSREDAMNSVSGLSSADMAGKFGKWHISSNSGDMNWYCQFTRYYQVRFEMNGGDGNIDPMYFVGDNSQSFNTNTLTNPTRTGYELTGWKDQDNTTYATSQNITVTKDLVLTAQWTAKTYAITLDRNNGSTDGSATATYDSNTLNNITHVGARTGYTLTGYFTLAENGSQVITAEGALVASAPDYTDENRNWKKASDCTLHAQWTANKYNVNFDFDGGADGKSSIDVTYDAAMPAVNPLPTREFYDFAGYYTAKNGQGTQYYTASGTSAHIWDITTDNTTLYAYWTPKSYAITWNFDGGQATSEDYTKGDVPYGTTIKAPTVEKTGYNFNGWNPAVGTMPGAAATYTAQWTAKQYTITLDKNADDGNGGSVKVTYDSNTTTEFSAPTRDNYIVEGFYAENTCTTKVMNADGSLVENVSGYTDASGNWVKDATCTLYTKWAEKPKVDALIVTGDVNNVEHNNGSASFTYTHPDDAFFGHKVLKIEYSGMSDNYGNSIISIDNGYQSSSSTGATGFGFWYKTDAGVTSIAFCLDYGTQKKTQLPGTNGAWKYVYVASSHASGWSGSDITIWMNGQDNNAATGDWTPLTLPHSGQTTYTNPSSGALYISEIRATEITEKFINYTVNFAADPSNKGTVTAQIKNGAAINSGDKVPEDTVVVFTASVNPGYEVVNWTDDSDNELAGNVTSFEQTITDNITVTANIGVEATKRTLTVNAGDHGSVSPTSQQVGEGRDVTITATPADGYLFDKWTSTGVNLTGHDTDNPLTITMPTNDVTLTATWKVDYCSNTFTIQCEDSYLPLGAVTGGTSSPSSSKFICYKDGQSGGHPYSSSSHGNGYIYIDDDSGKEIYFVFDAPEAGTYKFNVWAGDDQDMWLNVYTTDQESGDAVTYNTQTYKKKGNKELDGSKISNNFAAMGDLAVSLPKGRCIIGLYNGYGYPAYDQIVITADSKVFCPEMYEVNFAAYPLGMGTVTARIKNGATISSGDEVPENTVVVFAASNIASGYEVVNWTDGSGNELAGNVTSFEQTITSDTSVIANIAEIAEKYAVTATAGEHGTITSGADEYREGATVTIVTAPDANYKVGSATASNVSEFTIDGNNVSFTMPDAPVAVTINFVFDTVHNLIATGTSTNVGTEQGSGESGSINVSSITDPTRHFTHNVLEYNYSMPNWGSYCGYSLPKDAGYTPNSKATGLAFWYIADDNVYMEIKVDGNSKVFKLSSTNGEWHYIYLADEAAKTGTSFEIWMNYQKDSWQMTKKEGYVYFSEIQATNVTSQAPIVPPVNLTVEVSPAGGGSVTTYPETTTGLTKGRQVTLTATPEDNYRFVNWTVNDVEVSTEATYVRTVNATETITANFERVYTLIVGHDTNIASVTGEGQYAAGESVTVTATATQGYKFTNWTEGAGGDVLATTSSYTFDMPDTDDYTVYANSEEDIVTYHITLGECTNGSISAKVNDQEYTGGELDANTPVVLTATPAEGYGFVKWQDNNTDNTRIIYANAETEAITWTATFAVRHTVTATYGKPGTEVTGQGEYATGAQVTLEAFVSDKQYDYEYHFSKWETSTAPITGHEHDNPLTFTMPANDVSIKALFSPVECVDTFVIQCEDDLAYIPWNKQDKDLTKYPNSIPHDGECGPYHDYYNEYHGTGYYDYKKAKSAEMYYPIELPASTYKFEIWSASNGYKNCWMNLYIESDDANTEVVYKGVNYKKTNNVTANNDCGEGGEFAISGTIDNVVLSSPKSVIIGLYCGEDYGSFDQIKITATDNGEPNYVFCHELSTDTCIIKSGETKEIPVCGVRHLIMYEGGKANNEEDADVSNSVLYIRNVTQLDIWEDFALPYTADELKVWDAEDKQEYAIKPVVRNNDGTNKKGHFYLQELLDENVTAINAEFRQRWANTDEAYPQANKPYIIKFSTAQNNGYFAGRPVYYRRGGKISLPCKDNAIVENGGWPEQGKPAYYYYANNSLVDIIPYDAYVLNDDHTEFVLTEQPVVKPFHCYIQASEEMKAMAPRLRLVGGGSTPTLIPVVEALNVDAEGVFKFIMDDKVYILRNGVLYNAVGQHVK